MTDQGILESFRQIRRAQIAHGYAPHKPLLLLLALGRLQRGEPRMVEFAELDQPLKNLLTEFGPSSSPSSRHYPFWHLRTDESVWTLAGPQDLLTRPPAATPNLGELRSRHVAGGLPAEVYERLRENPVLLSAVARQLLSDAFPETLHEDILQAVGLDLHPGKLAEDAAGNYETFRRRKRDREFREAVLVAYEYRCCVCGFDMRVRHQPAGIEAAHIHWHTAGGPDVTPNGLALCSLHHKLFDLGAFCVEPGELRVVFSQHATSGQDSVHSALAHHGSLVRRPLAREHLPAPEFLAWNFKNVFKTPQRPSQPLTNSAGRTP